MITVWRWELVKLAALVRVRVVLGVCVVVPFALAGGLRVQSQAPTDTLFGRFVHQSGYATPLVVLGFASQWVLPLLVAVVAGDLLAGEDQSGTWPTVLTRGRGRAALLAGKSAAAATWAVLVVVVLAAASIAAGVVLIGHQPLVGLSGSLLPSGRALALVVAAWASVLLPCIGFAAVAVAFSAGTRHSAVGIGAPAVVGVVFRLAASIPGIAPVRRVLLTTPFDAWHGLVRDGVYLGPLWHGALVCLFWSLAALTVAAVTLRRRELTRG